MYRRNSEEILREVDSFIAQAKLEGEISGSSSSISVKNIENQKGYAHQPLENKLNSKMNVVTSNENETITSFTVNDENTYSNLNNIEKEKDIIEKLSQNQNIIKYKINLDTTQTEDNYKSENECVVQNNIVIGNENDTSSNLKKPNYKEESCDSSYVDLGNEQSRSSVPYVMWLQEKRSKQNLLEREEIHLHEVNSALFWERWIDKIFDIYDQWVQSSDNDEEADDELRRTQSETGTKKKTFPTRIKSEPIIRVEPREEVKLKYKCPSYVDWLVQKRQERLDSSESEEIIENKKQDGYWSSLYGKLTKSLSSIFISPKPLNDKDKLERGQSETTSLLKTMTGSPKEASRVRSTGLRRSHSVSCSYYQNSTSLPNKLRHRQLNQDAVGSPVLTDQLVELVCNTLSPDSSDGSSSQEDYRLRKRNRRNTKRKS